MKGENLFAGWGSNPRGPLARFLQGYYILLKQYFKSIFQIQIFNLGLLQSVNPCGKFYTLPFEVLFLKRPYVKFTTCIPPWVNNMYS